MKIQIRRWIRWLIFAAVVAAALAIGYGLLPPTELPPGLVIAHSPVITGRYIGSPTLAILPDGTYIAGHDYFGPGSGEHWRGITRIYVSHDRGATWSFQSEIKGSFWSVLFVDRGALYLLGVDRNPGRIFPDTWVRILRKWGLLDKRSPNSVVIRRSLDEGKTWTEPKDSDSGVLMTGFYGFAPSPVLHHNGYLWRSQSVRMMMAREDADLLKAASWEMLPGPARRPKEKFGEDIPIGGEGSAVVGPEGQILNISNIRYLELGHDHAVIVGYDLKKKEAIFDPLKDIVPMPGARLKFTTRWDPVSKRYWSLTNVLLPEDFGPKPALRRNTVALVSSSNLRDWRMEKVLLHDPDVTSHGLQYLEWDFEGEDIIALCRTAWPDGRYGPKRQHDSNFLTFHRFPNFRTMGAVKP